MRPLAAARDVVLIVTGLLVSALILWIFLTLHSLADAVSKIGNPDAVVPSEIFEPAPSPGDTCAAGNC